ncbi:preprotein translocase subunit YajC [Arthrobacter cryoconiti]|uniref:Preprotein translocase subunit YajC n=1 Tax=Arthrobacter cryoconiti TaxID=748907 RepID=A0ABV8QWU4_9MICC|nr:preprotein translocase subunit YajC [Arthrobacter cryoconiti]MCC9069904.1 preprotein translocase subunit YajC [Arthrobacter cryoconiti]
MTLSNVLAADQPAAAGGGIMNYVLFALFAVLILMMIRKSRKTKAAAQEKQSKLAPGVDIMTNFGLFGHVVDVDSESNKIKLEISPGVIVEVHSQTVAKIMEPSVPLMDDMESSIPDDASSLTSEVEKNGATGETSEETLARLNKDTNKDK